MKSYSSPKVQFIQLLLGERIALDPECMQTVQFFAGFDDSNGDCAAYTAVELGRPCCHSNDS